MVKSVIAVIGANFGDEGKGNVSARMTGETLMSCGKRVLNVLYNGGIQRAHAADSFVYHCFGAGTRRGADTYYTKDFYFAPYAIHKEYLIFGDRSLNLYVNPKAKVILPHDEIYNRHLENKRGGQKHGSCGMGIYEAVLRSEKYPVYAEDLFNTVTLYEKLKELRKEYFPKREEEIDFHDCLNLGIEDLMRNLFRANSIIHLAPNEMMNYYDSVIFEGGQGLLLDKDNVEYYPHLTPSHPGSQNIVQFMKMFDEDVPIHIYYTTRTFLTRHGAGPFPTECGKKDLGIEWCKLDDTNPENQFQGGMRYGFFDPENFFFRTKKDFSLYNGQENVRLGYAVTHMDLTHGMVCAPGKVAPIKDLACEYLPGEEPSFYSTYRR